MYIYFKAFEFAERWKTFAEKIIAQELYDILLPLFLWMYYQGENKKIICYLIDMLLFSLLSVWICFLILNAFHLYRYQMQLRMKKW